MKQCPVCKRELEDRLRFCPFDGQSLTDQGQKDVFINTLFDDKYRIDEMIGEGGMGKVYKATHIHMDTTVALKVLHQYLSYDRLAIERFRREARAAAQIRHPNAVVVIDFGVTKSSVIPYIVMEFLEGTSLRTRLGEQNQLDYINILEIIEQTCSGMQAAHSKGIIHRDLKPDNIWLVRCEDGLETVKVLDFGIAKLKSFADANPTLTQQGTIVGTPFYMSPEQCRGEELDYRSDIYSLGIILYEMLAGQVPFRAPTPIGVVHMHNYEIPKPLRVFRPNIPAPIEEVVLRALSKERDDRQSTATQLAEELETAFHSSGIEIPRPKVKGSRPVSRPTPNIPQSPDTEEFDKENRADRYVRGDKSVRATSKGLPKDLLTTEVPVNQKGLSAIVPHFRYKLSERRRRRLVVAVSLSILLFLLVSTIWLFGNKATPQLTNVNTNSAELPPHRGEPPQGMIQIPSGKFIMGNDQSDDEGDKPEHEVEVKAFYLDQHEVTNEQYYKFLEADKNREPPTGWVNRRYPNGMDNHPVVTVTWDDANAYAKWAGKRLPTEIEWEYAARGADKRIYPWGNEFVLGRANSVEAKRGGTVPIGSYLAGGTQHGVLDLVGNVAEWTDSDFRAYPGSKENKILPGYKVLRGCSFSCDKKGLILTNRFAEPESMRRPDLGFRCAKDVTQ